MSFTIGEDGCLRCLQCSPSMQDEVKSPPTWTRERPTKPGAYLIALSSPQEHPRADVWGYVEAALVRPTDTGLRVAWTNEEGDRPVDECDGLYWLGPLDPPE